MDDEKFGLRRKIIFNYTFLEKGNYVKLQPQTDDFLKVSNPKAVLEAKLRHFTCLTKSDVIGIEHNSKIYWINVLEVKPGTAISIIDTDIDVDFALPLINEKSELDAAKNNKNIPEIEKKNPAILSNFEDFSSEELNEDIKKSFLGKGEVVRGSFFISILIYLVAFLQYMCCNILQFLSIQEHLAYLKNLPLILFSQTSLIYQFYGYNFPYSEDHSLLKKPVERRFPKGGQWLLKPLYVQINFSFLLFLVESYRHVIGTHRTHVSYYYLTIPLFFSYLRKLVF
eukprot:10227_5